MPQHDEGAFAPNSERTTAPGRRRAISCHVETSPRICQYVVFKQVVVAYVVVCSAKYEHGVLILDGSMKYQWTRGDLAFGGAVCPGDSVDVKNPDACVELDAIVLV